MWGLICDGKAPGRCNPEPFTLGPITTCNPASYLLTCEVLSLFMFSPDSHTKHIGDSEILFCDLTPLYITCRPHITTQVELHVVFFFLHVAIQRFFGTWKFSWLTTNFYYQIIYVKFLNGFFYLTRKIIKNWFFLLFINNLFRSHGIELRNYDNKLSGQQTTRGFSSVNLYSLSNFFRSTL